MRYAWLSFVFFCVGAFVRPSAEAQDPPSGIKPRLLLIGDSHTAGTFGRELDKFLWDAGYPTETHALPGATATWFFTGENRGHYPAFHHEIDSGKVTRPSDQPTPKLADLLAKVQPGLTIVALGSNFEWLDKEPLAEQLRRTMRAIREAGGRCLWVGPPDMASVPESIRLRFYRILGEVAAAESCGVIDSFKIAGKHPPCAGQERCDSIHWDGYPSRARAWAREVGKRVLESVQAQAR